jgi:hypothetical protein
MASRSLAASEDQRTSVKSRSASQNAFMKAQKTKFPASVQIGVLAAAAICVWGALDFFVFESDLQSQSQNRDPYMVAAQPERFSGLKRVVSEDAVLGYLSDAEPGSTIAGAIFESAQYALAPRLLQMSTEREWVLGNFTRPADFQAVGARYSLHLERDFGNGVVLYRRTGR